MYNKDFLVGRNLLYLLVLSIGWLGGGENAWLILTFFYFNDISYLKKQASCLFKKALTFCYMANFKKWVNKLTITMGLLAILAAPVAFGATEASAWRCWILWWRWC